MVGEWIRIWKEEEYEYAGAYGFTPFMVSYIHEDREIHPAIIVVPGGAYRYVSPSEAHLPAMEFYRAGYNVFVLVYTTNLTDDPLKLQPMADLSRAVRLVRKDARRYNINPQNVAVCGFSAGGHLCASICVHFEDIEDPDPEYSEEENRPDAAILAYPVITAGEFGHKQSFRALLGEKPEKSSLEYMSLEKHVTKHTPPCFIWQTEEDASVCVENSYLFAAACRKAGVPFSHHVFSQGIHGLSVATEEWLERDFGDYYSREQIRLLVEAIRSGKTEYDKTEADQIEKEFFLNDIRKDKWPKDVKEEIRKTLPEVSAWTGMAETWLSRQWEILADNT